MITKSFQTGLNIAAVMGFSLFAGGEANARQRCMVDRDCQNYCPINVQWCCVGEPDYRYCGCGPQCQSVLEEKAGE